MDVKKKITLTYPIVQNLGDGGGVDYADSFEMLTLQDMGLRKGRRLTWGWLR